MSFRRKRDREPADISGADFSHADLSHKNFCGVRAVRSDFRGAFLDSARFDGADFEGANFEATDCCGLKARGTKLRRCLFAGADLEGSILDGADLSEADLSGANLKLSSLRGASLDGAGVKRADFRFCRGLSTEQKEWLRSRGARVSFIRERLRPAKTLLSFPYSLILGGVVLFGLAGGWLYYSSGFNRFNTASLHDRLGRAKSRGDYEEALTIDQELMRRYEHRGKLNSMFNRAFDMARIHQRTDRTDEAVRILESLLARFPDAPDKASKVRVELAAIRARGKNWAQVIALLEGLDSTGLSRAAYFEAQMMLAAALREETRYPEAVAVYRRLISQYKHKTKLRSRADSELAATYRQMEDDGKGRNRKGPTGAAR